MAYNCNAYCCQKYHDTIQFSIMIFEIIIEMLIKCNKCPVWFKQDELCFHVLFCYKKSCESGEMTIVSCKNCDNFIKVLEKPVFYFEPCIISSLYIVSSIDVPISMSRNFGNRRTDRKPDYSNPLLRLRGQGLMKILIFSYIDMYHTSLIRVQ